MIFDRSASCSLQIRKLIRYELYIVAERAYFSFINLIDWGSAVLLRPWYRFFRYLNSLFSEVAWAVAFKEIFIRNYAVIMRL